VDEKVNEKVGKDTGVFGREDVQKARGEDRIGASIEDRFSTVEQMGFCGRSTYGYKSVEKCREGV
jgi:hypothetical protein